MSVPTLKTHIINGLCGSTMRVLEAGEGRAVLLAHSYLWSADMWTEQIKALAPFYRVIAPDLWGHGGSGPVPASTRNLRDVARHHLDLMDVLGIDRFTLVGHSIGGMWGTELALMTPERVEALVLMNTYVGPEPAAARQLYQSMLALAERERAVPESLMDSLVSLFFHPATHSEKPDLVARFTKGLAHLLEDQILGGLIPLGRMFVGRPDLMNELASLPMPALVIGAAKDKARPPIESEVMAMALDCNFIELPDAGHISPVERPDDISRHLLRFLEQALAATHVARTEHAAPNT